MFTNCNRCRVHRFDPLEMSFDSIDTNPQQTHVVYKGRKYTLHTQGNGVFKISLISGQFLNFQLIGNHQCSSSLLSQLSPLAPSASAPQISPVVSPSISSQARTESKNQQFSLDDLRQAIKFSNLVKIEKIIGQGVKPTDAIYLEAINIYNPNVLAFLISSGVIPSTVVLLQAVSCNKLEMVKILVGAGVKVTSEVYDKGMKLIGNQMLKALAESKEPASEANLHYALGLINSNETLHILLSTGARPNQSHIERVSKTFDRKAKTMLEEAMAKNINEKPASKSPSYEETKNDANSRPSHSSSSAPSGSSSAASNEVMNDDSMSSTFETIYNYLKARNGSSSSGSSSVASSSEALLTQAVRTGQLISVQALMHAGNKPTDADIRLALDMKNQEMVAVLCGKSIDQNGAPPPYQPPSLDLPPPPFVDPFKPLPKS